MVALKNLPDKQEIVIKWIQTDGAVNRAILFVLNTRK